MLPLALHLSEAPNRKMIPQILPSAPDPATRTAAVVADDRAVVYLIDQLILKSGLTQSEIARRLGIKLQSLNQYRRRKRPGVVWLAKLAEACGGRLYMELPR